MTKRRFLPPNDSLQLLNINLRERKHEMIMMMMYLLVFERGSRERTCVEKSNELSSGGRTE